MRKQVKKQLEKMKAVERDRYRTACAKIRQLEIENAQLARNFNTCKEEKARLMIMFEQLQTDSEKEISDLSLVARAMEDTIEKRDIFIRHLRDTIDELKQPWWRKLWGAFRQGIEGKKGS